MQETLFKKVVGQGWGRRKENVQFSVSAENWAAQTTEEQLLPAR